MGKTKTLNSGSIFEIFLYIFLILEFYVYTINFNTYSQNIRTIFLILTALVGFVLFICKRNSLETIIYIVMLIVSWIVCSLIANIGEYYYGFDLMRYTLCYIGIALGLLSDKSDKIEEILTAFIYYSVAIIVLVRIVIFQADIETFMLNGSSYNFIPVLVLLYYMVYMIIRHQNGRNMSVAAAILFLMVTFASYGRSSIGTGIIIFLLTIYQNYSVMVNQRQKHLLVCVTIIILLAACFMLLSSTRIINTVFGNFVERGINSPSRVRIWSAYIQESMSNWKCLFFGGNPYKIRDDGNLHNFFLQMHASFGLIFSLINVGIILDIIIKSVKHKDIIIACLLISLLFKACFDKILFLGYNEIAYFYFVFYYFEKYSDTKLILKSNN